MYAILLAVLLPLVMSASDPTKVCMPDKLEFDSFNLDTEEGAHISVDFTQNMMVLAYPNRTEVEDFDDLKIYTIYNTGKCEFINLPSDAVFPQCLPANAVFLGEASFGFGPHHLDDEAWLIPFAGGTLQLIYSKQFNQPQYVFVSKYTDASGKHESTVYPNPTLGISKPEVFQIPGNCSPVKSCQ
ncbi:uncharacterized protein LOC131956255 [Physella acuta]|uniref:uncharacterized protein LOC131956255 n=1 Tax=Physella acuta TaxID=109671 RepID=UPI0027DAE6BF|nr:uncharacterized protein LOC131956255 [Physella acuta]